MRSIESLRNRRAQRHYRSPQAKDNTPRCYTCGQEVVRSIDPRLAHTCYAPIADTTRGR